MTDNGHLTESELAGFLDGDLAPAERTRVEAHLEACDPCRDELVAVTRIPWDIPEPGAAPSISARPSSPSWRLPAGIGGLAAAATIAFLFLLPAGPPPSGVPASPGLADRPAQVRSGTEGVARIETHFPAAGASVRRDALRFSWAAQGDASYRITLTAEDGARLWSATLQDTTAVPPADLELEAGRTHFWYVDAIDIGVTGRTGARPFTVAP
jgi:anti-sigma factor RsiW